VSSEENRSVSAVVVKRTINGDRRKIFRAFTDPGLMARWFFAMPDWSSTVTNELRVGGNYRIDMHSAKGDTYSHHGEYREIVPGEKIVFTWNSQAVQDTVVTVEFRDAGKATEITLIHEFLPDENMRGEHRNGWGGCLDNLEKFLPQSTD
jgi:uncharacterized protein YndB with AHSA1/START domain